MAGIDKIYVSSIKDWLQFRNWCIRNRRKCWNKTHRDILSYFYSGDINYITEWLNEITQKDRIMYEERRVGLKDRNSYEFYKSFTHINIPYEPSETYSERYNEALPVGSEKWKSICVVDEWAVDRYTEIFEEYKDGTYPPSEVPMTNFPQKIDIWLIKHCPIQFVRDRLKVQYNSVFDSIKLGKMFK